MRRLLAVAVVVALLCGTLTPVAASGLQESGNTPTATTASSTPTTTPTATPTPTATGTPTATSSPTPTATPVPPNADDGPPTSEFDLRELRYQGEIVDSRYPSLRVADESIAFWSVAYPPTGFNSYGSQSAKTTYLQSNTTVHRNKVRLFATHPFDGEQHQYEATVVYWTPDTRSTGPNGNQTERVANVSRTATQTLTFGPGFKRYDDLKLAGYYDGTRRVTVFLANQDGDRVGQWTFKQASIKSAQPVNIDSRGELWNWVGIWVFLPTVVLTGLSTRVAPSLRKRGGPPGRLPHMLGFGILVGAVSMTVGYYALTSLVAAIPLVFPITIAYIVFAIQLNDKGEIQRTDLFQFFTNEVQSPVDADATVPEINEYDRKTVQTIALDGKRVIYNKGFGPFIARLNDCYAEFDIENAVNSRFKRKDGNEEILFVDEDVDEILEHIKEGVLLAWPWRTYSNDDLPDDPEELTLEQRRKRKVLPDSLGWSNAVGTVVLGLVIAGSCFAAQQHLGSWLWGTAMVVPAALWYAEPVDGYGRVQAANGHASKAFAMVMKYKIELKRWADIDDLHRKWLSSERQKKEAKRYGREQEDRSIMAEANDPESDPFDPDVFEDDPARSESSSPDDDLEGDSRTATEADD